MKREGQARALQLDNRGPLTFDENGELDSEIRAAYSKYGFYVFEGLVGTDELKELSQDLEAVRSRFPVVPNGEVDAHGNTELGFGNIAPTVQWAKPLSDPLGGSDLYNGRHQVNYSNPKPAKTLLHFLRWY